MKLSMKLLTCPEMTVTPCPKSVFRFGDGHQHSGLSEEAVSVMNEPLGCRQLLGMDSHRKIKEGVIIG